jgi:hypothetical protein
MTLVHPWTYLDEFSMCKSEISGDTLYVAVYDSLIRPGIAVKEQDSMVTTDISYIVYPFESMNAQQVKQYGDPVIYDKCEYKVYKDSVYARNIGPVTVPDVVLVPENRLTIDEERRLIFVYATHERYIDTTLYTLIHPAETFIGLLSAEEWDNYCTEVEEDRLMVLQDRFGAFHQIINDTLYLLEPDSSIEFDDHFADVTALHADGKVDISFIHEKYTDYKQEILFENINPITGEIESLRIRSIGAWKPESRSCFDDGVPNAECHNRMGGETYWYKENAVIDYRGEP